MESQFEHSKSVAISPFVNSKAPNPPPLPCRAYNQNFTETCFFHESMAMRGNSVAFVRMFSFCHRYLSGGTFGSMAHRS